MLPLESLEICVLLSAVRLGILLVPSESDFRACGVYSPP